MPALPALQLDLDQCRVRQERLTQVLQDLELDRVVITGRENIQYLTGFRSFYLMAGALCLDLNGRSTLAAPNSIPDHVQADEVVTFEAQWLSTLRQDQVAAAAEALAAAIGPTNSVRLGADFGTSGPHELQALGNSQVSLEQLTDVEPHLCQLRRLKDPDELVMIERAIACTDAMYERAREIITPGINELEVFNQLHAAAVEVAGEPLTALGNDYQCNQRGGPPRNRDAQAGELFILDLGPAYRGYYADNCRTFSVDRSPTDDQLTAWQAIVETLEMVESTVKPGVSSRALYEQAAEMLARCPLGEFPHHLGHGFGLYPHEAPHLNPNWDDTFQEGEVFTAEPGLYGPTLAAGIRLEQNYLVTATGVQRLTSFPLEL